MSQGPNREAGKKQWIKTPIHAMLYVPGPVHGAGMRRTDETKGKFFQKFTIPDPGHPDPAGDPSLYPGTAYRDPGL